MPNKAEARSSNSRWGLFAFAVLLATAAFADDSPAMPPPTNSHKSTFPARATLPTESTMRGQIVGSFANTTGHLWLSYTDGSFTQIDVPASRTARTASTTPGRSSGLLSGPRAHGFLYAGGSFTQLDVPGQPIRRLRHQRRGADRRVVFIRQSYGFSRASSIPAGPSPKSTCRAQWHVPPASTTAGRSSGLLRQRARSMAFSTPVESSPKSTCPAQSRTATGINDTGQIVGDFLHRPH